MRKEKLQYKKKKNVNKSFLATLKIVLTFGSLSIIGVIIYFGVANGWQSLLDWFTTKWACMAAVLIVVFGTIVWWLVDFFRNLKKVTEDEK